MLKYQKEEFENKRKALKPTLYFCGLFFSLYYAFLIIPRYGVDTEVFLIDNIGGSFIVLGFVAAIFLTKKFSNNLILMLPSFATLATASLFLLHEHFYTEVGHLWLSAQIIGVIFSIYLGTPVLNSIFFIANVCIPPLIASQVAYLDTYDIIVRQAIIYFSSIVSIYLSYSSRKKIYKLIESRDKAHLAEKSKSEFLANMSHEIRTPMNGVLGSASILLESKGLSDDDLKYLKNIMESGHSMMNVLNDILDYSKIEAGYLEIEYHDFSLNDLLKSVKNLYLDLALEKDIR